MLKTLLLPIFFTLLILSGEAQTRPAIPLMRKIFHENIDRSQKSLDKIDRKEDKALNAGSNEEVNLQVTYSLFNQVDELQNGIEADSLLSANDKIKFLRGLNEVLVSFDNGHRMRIIKTDALPALVNGFVDAMSLERRNESLLPVIAQNDIEIGEILIKSFAFQKNKGLQESRDLLVLKACEKNPERILPILKNNPNISFADSLIKIVARTEQEDIYTYAQATNTELGKRINQLEDPLVKTIVALANLKSGRLYFPFLDNLYKGKMTMDEVTKNLDDEYRYFRMLVNTQIDYADRLRKRDTPMVAATLTAMLRKKALEDFILVINGLHDSPDAIRMKKVEPLNAQELYYLCVMGETEIYTSSYLKCYDRIFQRMKSPNSDTLLMSVNFDHFKKFIKMAAGYNTLDDFLKRMGKDNAVTLMKAFVTGLDKTNSLEDAVDVADSYASISDPQLKKLMQDEAQANITKVKTSRRGVIIYDLLNTIFQSMDTTRKVDLSEKFGIPSVFGISNKSLIDTAIGRIIIQQFFYGDKDGIGVFNNFRSAYANANWKTVNKPEWIEVSSVKGVPITIYANKPLDETLDLDAKAQANMGKYLEASNLSPTVVIHRGHSYYVKYTLEQLAPSAKIVLLGSCGGYHNLHNVLDVCPYAQIIASKQVGSGTVNQPMIISLTELMRQGKDLDWPSIWKSYEKKFEKNPLFEDYVPPHKNLGAIFIMAYNKVMEAGV